MTHTLINLGLFVVIIIMTFVTIYVTEKKVEDFDKNRKVKIISNKGNPIHRACKIYIPEVGWVGKDLQIAKLEEDAMTFVGKNKTKKVVKFLKKSGLDKVDIKEM